VAGLDARAAASGSESFGVRAGSEPAAVGGAGRYPKTFTQADITITRCGRIHFACCATCSSAGLHKSC
jgi:hypothetical protein